MNNPSMHQTPGVPGTSPVTDNPNPGGTQGSVPSGPGTDLARPGGGEGDITGPNPTESRPRTEGGANVEKYFRCGDLGNADCRWEVIGRTEDELHPQIHRHLRDVHGSEPDDRLRSHIKDVIRDRAA